MPRDTCMPHVLSLPCNFVSYVVFEKFQCLFRCTKCGKGFVVCHVCQKWPGTRAALMTRVLYTWLYIFRTKCWFQKIPMAIWVYKVWKRFFSMPCLSEMSSKMYVSLSTFLGQRRWIIIAWVNENKPFLSSIFIKQMCPWYNGCQRTDFE